MVLTKYSEIPEQNFHESDANWEADVFGKTAIFVSFFVFSRLFILLSRESDQCAVRACLGASHLSTTPR